VKVERFTPADVMKPIGPYSHIAKAGPFISISGTAGVDPVTNQLAGPDVQAQTRQILKSFRTMLRGVGADMPQVMHIHVFLKRVEDFEEMNRAYKEEMGADVPARTVICVKDLPKEGALLTMNLTAVADE